MRVGLTSPGQMGTGLGGVLVRHGATVLVDVSGRSAAGRARASAAGLTPVDGAAELAEVDVILSVSPPGIAPILADRYAKHVGRAGAALYLDANAVAPDTARAMAAVITGAGGRFCDGGIIGLPPGTAAKEPVLFVSGPDTAAAERLAEFGLQVKRVDSRVGAASALKMSYAGITKGLVALGAAMMLNAEREGVGAALATELAASQAQVLAGFRRSIPDMFGKAGRWVAEMEEIAGTCPPSSAEQAVYQAFARFYDGMAGENGPERQDTLRRFLTETATAT